jgi:hypothetical protein
MTHFNEETVEQAALDCLRETGYAVRCRMRSRRGRGFGCW